MIGGAASRITVEIGGRIAASLNRSLREAQTQVSSLGRNVNRSLADASRGFKNVVRSDAFQTAAVAAGGLTLAIGGSVRAAMDFESAMADVRKVVDFPTPQAFADMRSDIMQLSREIPISATGFTEIIAAAGQAGIARNELTRFARSAAQMGVAFDISAGEAGNAMAQLRTSMGLNQDGVEQLADAMNHLSNSMASSAPDITDFMLRTGALGRQIAITTEQQAALGSAMIAAGAQPEVAATSFRNLVRALTKGDSATNRQADAMERLGLTTTEVARTMQQDAVGTIQDVFARLNQMPAEMRVALASDIFGDEARALAPLITNAELMAGALDQVGDRSRYTGSMLREFEARSATSANQIQLFQNNVNGLGIAIGTAVLPAINKFFTALTPLLSRVVDLATEFPGITTAVVGVSAAFIGLVAIAPFLASFITVAKTLGAVIGAAKIGAVIAGWAGAAGPALAAIKAGLIALTGPVGLTIAAIVGIGAALVLAYQRVEWFRNGVNAIWRGIQEVFQGVMNYLGGAWKVVTGILMGDADRASQGMSQAFGGLRQIFGTIVDGITAVWSGFFNFIGDLVQRVAGFFQEMGPTILAVMFPIPAAILGAFGALPPGTQAIFNQVVEFIRSVPGMVAEVGAAIIDTIIDGIKSRADALVETVRTAFTEVRNLMPFSDAKEGPFKYLTASGKAIVGTLARGISQATPVMSRAFSDAADETMRILAGPAMTPALAGAGLTAAGVPVRSRPVVPQYSRLDVPAPTMASGGRGATNMNMRPTINVNVAGSNSSADDIADTVMRAFQNILSDAEASARSFLND